MKPKENYLYGTLLALVREQLEALQKLSSGKLGMWGRGRLGVRTEKITKFVFKILMRKDRGAGTQAANEMLADLDFIESDNRVWSDIRPEELEYLRTIVSQIPHVLV